MLAGPPTRHDALVARAGSAVVGLASLVAEGDDAGELGVLVADAWQRRGVGRALTTALLERARDRGLKRFGVLVLPGRTRLLASLSRQWELVEWSIGPDGTSCVYRLF
ncbi:GNAT family N-acetyltransferase [Streptacidiphilus monticola]